MEDVAANLKADLLAKGYSETDLSGLTNYLQLREANGGIPNSNLVTNINVQGEFLSGVPWNIPDRIGTTVLDIAHGAAGVSGTELHSQALLTAFLLSNQGATGGNSSSPPLNEISKKLPNLLGLIFDKDLFANDTDTDERNLLEHLVRHQAGVPGQFSADDMLIHFTNDMQDIVTAGGKDQDQYPYINLNKALIAFGLQAYYEQKAAFTQEAFQNIGGGVRFDRAMIAGDLNALKGYDQYFHAYLSNRFNNDLLSVIESKLPTLPDWFIGTGTNPVNGVADTQSAFMLGDTEIDQFIGGSQDDLIIGGDGSDILEGNEGSDTLYSGNDILLKRAA